MGVGIPRGEVKAIKLAVQAAACVLLFVVALPLRGCSASQETKDVGPVESGAPSGEAMTSGNARGACSTMRCRGWWKESRRIRMARCASTRATRRWLPTSTSFGRSTDGFDAW